MMHTTQLYALHSCAPAGAMNGQWWNWRTLQGRLCGVGSQRLQERPHLRSNPCQGSVSARDGRQLGRQACQAAQRAARREVTVRPTRRAVRVQQRGQQPEAAQGLRDGGDPRLTLAAGRRRRASKALKRQGVAMLQGA